MKNIAISLCFISIVVLITLCEKSPEKLFDLSLIPGQYSGSIHVSVFFYDTILERYVKDWGQVIPEDPYAKHIIEIQKFRQNQYELIFDPVDTILPNDLVVEIIDFQIDDWDEIRADFRVLENDSFIEDPSGHPYVPHNYLQYSEDYRRILLSIYLMSKTQDKITYHGFYQRWVD